MTRPLVVHHTPTPALLTAVRAGAGTGEIGNAGREAAWALGATVALAAVGRPGMERGPAVLPGA